MSNIINRRKIADGVYFSSITDKRYKKNLISVAFSTQLNEDTATENVIVPALLTKSRQFRSEHIILMIFTLFQAKK